MNWELYAAFVAATAVLIVIPGPAVTLVVASSLAHGSRRALATVAGCSTAILWQLFVVAAGMTSVMAVLAGWFEWLRWAGVAYIFFLAFQAWRAPLLTLEELEGNKVSARRLFFQGLVVNSTNPKTLFFYAAFFPQFVDPTKPLALQLLVLCSSFLLIAILFDSSYAFLAGRLRHLLHDRRRARIRNRITGGLLFSAGLGLALVRRGG